MPPIKPMLAKSVSWEQLEANAAKGAFGGRGYGQFEPKWDYILRY
jgi:hypothetical protein